MLLLLLHDSCTVVGRILGQRHRLSLRRCSMTMGLKGLLLSKTIHDGADPCKLSSRGRRVSNKIPVSVRCRVIVR